LAVFFETSASDDGPPYTTSIFLLLSILEHN
jgi:hypothetical protein